jgi:hypothetical protein
MKTWHSKPTPISNQQKTCGPWLLRSERNRNLYSFESKHVSRRALAVSFVALASSPAASGASRPRYFLLTFWTHSLLFLKPLSSPLNHPNRTHLADSIPEIILPICAQSPHPLCHTGCIGSEKESRAGKARRTTRLNVIAQSLRVFFARFDAVCLSVVLGRTLLLSKGRRDFLSPG